MRRGLLVVLLGVVWLAAGSPARWAYAQQAPAESPRAAQIRAHLHDILSSTEFRVDKPGDSLLEKIGKWIERAWESIQRFFGRLFSFGGAGRGGGSYLFLYVVLGVLIVGIAYVIAYVIRNIHRGPRSKVRRPDVSAVAEPDQAAASEPDAWIAAARRHAAAGDFRRAYRAVFIAVLLRLDRIGALRYERSLTNGEYLRALRSRPPLLAFLRPLATEFDRHWYGRTPVSQTDYERALAAYESVITVQT